MQYLSQLTDEMNKGHYEKFINTCSIGGIETIGILIKAHNGAKYFKEELSDIVCACCDWLDTHKGDDLVTTYCRLTRLRLMGFISAVNNISSEASNLTAV